MERCMCAAIAALQAHGDSAAGQRHQQRISASCTDNLIKLSGASPSGRRRAAAIFKSQYGSPI